MYVWLWGYCKSNYKKGHSRGVGISKWNADTKYKVSESLRKFQEKKRRLVMESLPFEKWSKAIIKRLLFKEIGNRCEKCSFEYTDPVTGKGPFEPHHKDGNKNNWKRENLEILCLNCHWMTPNWKFKGRKHTLESIKKGFRTKGIEWKGKVG